MAPRIKDCLFCGKFCVSASNLEADIRRHHILERVFFCKQCPHSCFSNGELKAHNLSHGDNRIFACGSCPFIFKDSGNLRRHMNAVHQQLKRFKCTMCSKAFPENHMLKTHMIIHTGEKPHSCAVCSKSFNLLGNLKRHMKIHFTTERFPCHVCGRVYAAKAYLRSHLKIHNGDKKFECKFCSYKCVNISMLNSHMVTHTRERHHHCKKCSIEFGCRESKKNHDRSFHTEGTGKKLRQRQKKVSTCVFCEEQFKGKYQRRFLEGHILAHICERPFICQVCNFEFRYKKHLVSHQKKYVQ